MSNRSTAFLNHVGDFLVVTPDIEAARTLDAVDQLLARQA